MKRRRRGVGVLLQGCVSRLEYDVTRDVRRIDIFHKYACVFFATRFLVYKHVILCYIRR